MTDQHEISEFHLVDWADLEKMTDGHCPCCEKQFNEEMRPEMTGKCHTGPVFVSYWDGELYFECGQCRKPICRIRVDRRLV